MTIPARRVAAVAFLLASGLWLFAALLPWIRGRALNGTFLAVAAVWFVVGLAILQRKGEAASGPTG